MSTANKPADELSRNARTVNGPQLTHEVNESGADPQ
jgi:hypothetical protein